MAERGEKGQSFGAELPSGETKETTVPVGAKLGEVLPQRIHQTESHPEDLATSGDSPTQAEPVVTESVSTSRIGQTPGENDFSPDKLEEMVNWGDPDVDV